MDHDYAPVWDFLYTLCGENHDLSFVVRRVHDPSKRWTTVTLRLEGESTFPQYDPGHVHETYGFNEDVVRPGEVIGSLVTVYADLRAKRPKR